MKHAIDRAAWSPEERDEYEDLLAEVCNASKDSTERLDLFEEKLADAQNAQRGWAFSVSSSCRRFGLGKEITRFEDRNRALVSHDGRLLSVPRVQARRVVAPTGEVTYQRELIEVWTWEQIAEKRAEAIQARRSYTDKVAHYDRLLALRDLCPQSTSPAEAAAELGWDLDEYLARAA